MQFVVKDKNSKAPMPVHQSFIAFVHEESQREVIYVAEPDKTSHLYTFDLVYIHLQTFLESTNNDKNDLLRK